MFKQLESLTLDGPDWSIKQHATGVLPRLKHLSIHDAVFVVPEVIKDMPALTSLHLTGEESFTVTGLTACLLRMPRLEQVTFASSAGAAQRLLIIVMYAVYSTTDALAWWKPDLSALARGVSAPEHHDVDGDCPNGWYLFARGSDEWTRNSAGFYSCTKPTGVWSIRVHWPKSSQQPLVTALS